MKNKPWLDQNGKALSDAVLKEVSRTWSAETWEEYLLSLEGRVRTEDELSIPDLAAVDCAVTCSLADLQPNTDHFPDEFLECVKQAVENLPARERGIIEEEIYFGKSQRETAEKLGISRSVTRKQRKRAQGRLAARLARYWPL